MLKRLLLVIGLFPAFLGAQPERPFFFVQLADPQFGMYPLQKDFHKERENLSLAIEAVNRLHPEFVVICGDLVNNRNDRRQREAFRESLEKLDKDIPLYLVPGNHDLGNTPTSKTISNYRKNFGADYYSFKRSGWTFIVLNSSLVKEPSHARTEASDQLDWLKASLDTASKSQSNIIVFQHHPWFVKYANEPNGYFNIPRKQRMEYLNLLQSHGVSYVFAGHLHQNADGTFQSLSMVTSGPVGMPLGTSPSGLRIVIVRPSGVEHKYYGLNKIPERVDLNNVGTNSPTD